METPQSVIEKIQKLLKLAECKGAGVGEAANAAAAAQKLMTEYRISVADIGEAPGTEEQINNNYSIFQGERIIHWRSQLATSVCAANGCKMYYNYSNAGFRNGRAVKEVQFRVVGRDSDIQIVDYFFKYLCNEIERLAAFEMAFNRGRGKSWSDSFKKGAAVEVSRRLLEANQQAKRAASQNNSTALVKLDQRDADVQRWMRNNLNLRAATTKSSLKDSGAFNRGREAGSKIQLNKGMGSGKGPKLLG